jgi:hypothetical protein
MNKKNNRIGQIFKNNQGYLMRIIDYVDANNIVVEFQDEYKALVNCSYRNFKTGFVRNPYAKSSFGVGMIGNKYPTTVDGKPTKEYQTWYSMLQRSFSEEFKNKNPSYEDVTCCDEWLLYDNFYEWLHSQVNFNKWISGNWWSLDKDILIKGNKVYSPNTCCLISKNINSLFTKCDKSRGDLPIGVEKYGEKFIARCNDCVLNKLKHIGIYETKQEAFDAYKKYKESLIKSVADKEYNDKNITKECYDAMMKYEVEFTD